MRASLATGKTETGKIEKAAKTGAALRARDPMLRVLQAASLSYAELAGDGTVLSSGGPLSAAFTVGGAVVDALPLLVGMEGAFAELLAPQSLQAPLSWPNVSLPELAAGQVFDVRLSAVQGRVLLTLTERMQQADLDQQVMQARNELALTKSALDQAREEAELANQSKDQLLLLLRERVREPLTALIMATQGLRDDLSGQDRRLEQQAKGAMGEGMRLLELLDSLLDIADGAAGGLLSFVEELGAARAIQLALTAAEQGGVACDLRTREPEQDRSAGDNQTSQTSHPAPRPRTVDTRLSLDPRRFQELVEGLSRLARRHSPGDPVWRGPYAEANLWVLRLDMTRAGQASAALPGDVARALRQPSTYLRTGTDPDLMHVALLLRATGMTCQWQETQGCLRLAFPVLKHAD